MTPVLRIALNTFREVIRNKILYAVFAFAFLLLVVSALFGSVTLGDRIFVIKDFGLFALSFCGAIIVVLAGVSLLDRELKQKTIYNLLSKPVERSEFIVGKFLGLVFVSSVLTSLMGVLFILFTAAFEGRFDKLLFEGVFFVIWELVLLSAIAILFSSLVLTTSLAGLFTFGTYLAGHSHRALDYFMNTRADFSSPILRFIARILKSILPDLGAFNVTDTILYGSGVSLHYAFLSVIYSIGYAIVCLLIAISIFRLRNFE